MACVWRCITPNYTCTVRRCCLFVQKRHRYKKKWAVNLPSKSPSELALEHFDAFYKPLFGRQWPSVRVSLLSLPKYAAIINSVSESEASVQQLMELGAFDLIQEAVNNIQLTQKSQGKYTSVTQASNDDGADDINHNLEQSSFGAVKKEIKSSKTRRSASEVSPVAVSSEEVLPDLSSSATQSHALEQRGTDRRFYATEELEMKNLLTPDALKSSTDLEYFMPTEQVFSEKEELRQQEYAQSMYQERAISASMVPGQFPLLPRSLKVMAFPSGDVSDFPRPEADKSHLLNYYLLDAASILPVLALDVHPGDNVLDLCAAPGGKTLALLQIILSQGGHIDSNDVSRARVKRLKTVLRSYLSDDLQREFVAVTERNGLTFQQAVYDKVLVDVPCNSDRHVLLEEDNNLFKPGRINDRLKMTTQQKDLLLAGIKSCKPGGSVVYSTCTLAAVQNDGVVQAALEELWETSDIDVVVEDLSSVKTMFTPFFKFHSNTRLGLLILPSLLNNFGPTYCCKLRRLQ